MFSLIIYILLGLGCIAIAVYLHKTAIERPDPKFGRVDFLFAYLTYLFGFEKLFALTDFTTVQGLITVLQVLAVIALFLRMRTTVKEVKMVPTREKFAEEIVLKTRKEIYDKIMQEKQIILDNRDC